MATPTTEVDLREEWARIHSGADLEEIAGDVRDRLDAELGMPKAAPIESALIGVLDAAENGKVLTLRRSLRDLQRTAADSGITLLLED